MSQQPAAAKPTLQGVRIKARKRAVKASAKHEPTGEHRAFVVRPAALTLRRVHSLPRPTPQAP